MNIFSNQNKKTLLIMVTLASTISFSALSQETDDPTLLDEIVVDNPGEPETENPLGIGISGDTLKSTPGSAGDPLRSLQSLPGMNFSDDGEAEPAVRGSRPGENYFQTDWTPSPYLFHVGGIISVYNAELVESFSIYPSAYGPEYYGVLGGVFDVKLRDPKSDRFHLTADVSFLHTGILFEGPVSDNQSFYLAGRFSYLDLFVEDQIDDEEEGISIVEFPNYDDYQGKYVWNINDDSTLRFQFNGASDDLEFFVDEDSPDIATEPIFAGRQYQSERSDNQALVLDQNIGDINIKSALSHRLTTAEAVIGQAGTVDTNVTTFMAKSQIQFPFGESHDLTLGFDISQIDADIDIDINAPACTEFEAECNITNAERLEVRRNLKVRSDHLFLKDNWYLTDNLTLIPGVSIQQDNYLDESFVEPRFAMEYAMMQDLTLSAGAGIYNQRPEFGEIDEVFGNPDLEYIKSIHGVLGVEKGFANGWSVKSELYYKDIDNLITGDETLRYLNDGEGVAYGLDTLIRKNVTDKLSGWVSLSLAKAERRHKVTGDEFVFDYDQPYNLSVVANYKFSKKWSVGAKLWMHSGAPYTPITGSTPDPDNAGQFNPTYGDINSARLDDYQRLDVRIDHTFNKTWTAYLDLINILDTKNVSGFDYNEDYSKQTPVEQIPRIASIGFKAKF